jgi:sensor histidine kinase YesM
LRVEDDGIGGAGITAMRRDDNGRRNGVGLENVALRLNALYQDQSRLDIDMRRTGGTTVTILLPRETGVTA